MDIHAPDKPVHSLREFFIHIAIVTIGILIALGLEGVREVKMIEWRVGRLLPGLLVLLATSPALAAGSNLCRQQEDALFSCTLTSGKQVSACAGVNEPSSSATSSPSTYRGLTYRFGSAEHIELSLSGTFPALRKQIFADEETAQNPIEDDFYLRFYKSHLQLPALQFHRPVYQCDGSRHFQWKPPAQKDQLPTAKRGV